METLEIKKENVLTAYNAADEASKKLLRNLFGEKTFSQKIADRVKTFEDACKELRITPGVEPLIIDVLANDSKSIKAYCQLIIITRALNEGWEPDWSNSNQYKYYPWFKSVGSGSGFSFDDCSYDRSCASVGSRLVFKSRELAEYAGKQFQSIYNEYFTL